jgi:hypothetical protein
VIHAGHLGGLAAHQRAAGLYAAFGNATDDSDGHLDGKLARGVVVEEEQGLRSLYGHIVHAHCDQVDADAVMATGVYGQAQFGAHAIGTRHQHGLAIALWQPHQGAESANPGQDFRALRAADQRLDPFDKFIAGIYIDASVTISQATGVLHRS